MKITIKDIAKLAGVSHTTVSRALNNSQLISDAQKARILAIAREHNYSPNMLARGLSGNKSFTIGVLLNFFGNPFAQRIMYGVENEAEQNEYVMLFGDSRECADRELKYIKTFLDRGVDGLIVYPVALQDNYYNVDVLKQSHIPYVMVNHQPHGTRSDIVSCNHFEGGYLAAKHLLSLKHKNIALIAGYGIHLQSEVVLGYRKALSESGIAFNTDFLKIFKGFYLEQDRIKEATLELLNDHPETSAIFAYSDEIIPGIMKALNAMHLKVPDDISVIGFGGIPEISSGYPNLTGVHYSKEAVGKQAMSLLVDKIKDKDFPQSNILIPMSIKKGNSCRKI
jgi:LacI family transcriptional regulator